MAIETLRPNGAGDETSIDAQYPTSGAHWEKVDEAVADDNATYVSAYAGTYQRDLYELPASSGSGPINKITVFFRIKSFSGDISAKASIKSGSTVSDGSEVSRDDNAWETYSYEFATNPDDSAAWEWADIDALQIGVSLKLDFWEASVYCTQVYVEVDYTKSRIVTMGGKSRANIAKVSGKSMADIVSIGGVPNV